MYATSGAFFYDGAADDLSVLALNLEHGVVATTSVGRAPTTGHPHGYGGDRRVRVMGSHGTIVVDAGAPSLAVYGNGRAEQRYYGARVDRAPWSITSSPRRAATGARIGPRDARAALEVILAARESAATIASSTCRRTRMKLVTFQTEDGIRHGMLRGEPDNGPSSTSVPATSLG